jgi:hypothetical protein
MKPRRRRIYETRSAKNQETNITRVKRRDACISLKSHKPWKAQILMKLKKLGISQSLES